MEKTLSNGLEEDHEDRNTALDPAGLPARGSGDLLYIESRAAVHQKGEAAKLLGDTIASQISSDTGYRALCLKDGTFIGEAGILQVNKNDNRCRLGYRLLPAYWGNGYATEIVTALAQLAFRVLKMERVEALTLAENRAACAVLEKAGFTKEGELRHYRRLVSDYQNVCFYGKLRTDV